MASKLPPSSRQTKPAKKSGVPQTVAGIQAYLGDVLPPRAAGEKLLVGCWSGDASASDMPYLAAAAHSFDVLVLAQSGGSNLQAASGLLGEIWPSAATSRSGPEFVFRFDLGTFSRYDSADVLALAGSIKACFSKARLPGQDLRVVGFVAASFPKLRHIQAFLKEISLLDRGFTMLFGSFAGLDAEVMEAMASEGFRTPEGTTARDWPLVPFVREEEGRFTLSGAVGSIALAGLPSLNWFEVNLVPARAGGERAPQTTRSIPEWPEPLLAAAARGDAVLFSGAGVAAQAGLPVWNQYVRRLLRCAAKEGIVGQEMVEDLRKSLNQGESAMVADAIALRAWQSPEQRRAILQDLAAAFQGEAKLTAAHQALQKIPFRAALTSNFDALLYSALADRGPRLMPQETEALKDRIAKKEFFTLYLYGTPELEDSLLLTSLQFTQFMDANLAFSEALGSLYLSSTFFFVGCSFEGIQGYLSGIRLSPSTVPHFALMDVAQNSLWKSKADVLRLRYNIQVIPYEAGERWERLAPVLEDLAARVRARMAPEKSTALPLDRVVLKNIGPFRELDLRFRSKWTLLIGGNGVGKTSILRAIATAYAGQAAKGHHNLLRAQQSEGRIEVHGRQAAVVNIRRTDRVEGNEQAKVECSPERPLELEGHPVIGFPALRAFREPGPPVSVPPVSRPVPEDVLGLAENRVDQRLSNLKSWLINLEHSANAKKYAAIRDYFYVAMSELAAGVTIEPGRIDPQRGEVMVKTADGMVPVELVSQGTSSLMCWVGVLLQRLCDINEGAAEPWNKPAVALIDEIDTHMHPRWQRLLADKLQQLFPNVQFVATTHSPLLIAGLAPSNIVVLRRADGDVQCGHLPESLDVRGMRADQILTSPVFGLDATRDPKIEAKLEEYTRLSLLENPKKQEEAKLAALAAELNLYRVSPEETAEARRAAEAIEEYMRSRFEQLDEGVLEEIRAQMLEIKSRFKRPQ